MISVYILIAILITHLIGDFVVQGHIQAAEKWHDNVKLTNHVISYTITLMMGVWLSFGIAIAFPWLGYKVAEPVTTTVVIVCVWAIINGVLHWITDYITSKHVHRLKEAGPFRRTKYKDMMIVIGLDQVIHIIILVLTWRYLPMQELVSSYLLTAKMYIFLSP